MNSTFSTICHPAIFSRIWEEPRTKSDRYLQYTTEEIARRGRDIYARRIRREVEPPTSQVRRFFYDSPTAGVVCLMAEKVRLRVASFKGERLLRTRWSLAVLVVGRYHHIRKPQAL